MDLEGNPENLVTLGIVNPELNFFFLKEGYEVYANIQLADINIPVFGTFDSEASQVLRQKLR